MIQDSEVNVSTCTATGNVRLQVEINEATKSYLRIKSIRRNLTMGQLLDEIVELFRKGDVSETNS